MRNLTAHALVLALLLTGCAASTATRPLLATSNQSGGAAKSVNRSSLESIESRIGSSNYCVVADGRQIQVELRNPQEVANDLPLNIRMRQAMVEADEQEWYAVLVSAGMDPSTPLDKVGGVDTVKGMLSYFRASDGIEFLVDNNDMALWFRAGKGPWTCAVSGVNVVKTFGGAFPHLPLCYVGAKRFLIAETLPGRIVDNSAPFPTRQCATFLLDCGAGRVVARSDRVTYDHNPPLVLPKDWRANYGFEIEPNAAPNEAPPYR
jgi:hypothetical protein